MAENRTVIWSLGGAAKVCFVIAAIVFAVLVFGGHIFGLPLIPLGLLFVALGLALG